MADDKYTALANDTRAALILFPLICGCAALDEREATAPAAPAPFRQDEELRARIAAGCETNEECDALERAARAYADTCHVIECLDAADRDVRRAAALHAQAQARIQAEVDRKLRDSADRMRVRNPSADEVEANRVKACAADHDERVARIRNYRAALADVEKKVDYAHAHCRATHRLEDTAWTDTYVDSASFVHVVPVQAEVDVWHCPAGAPAGINGHSDVEITQSRPTAPSDAIARSQWCRDIDIEHPEQAEGPPPFVSEMLRAQEAPSSGDAGTH